jgi:hypothetical protein
MNRRLFFPLLILLVSSSLYGGAVERQLAASGGQVVEPVDPLIGVLSGSGVHVDLARKLLAHPYDLSWVETYVDSSLRYQFTHTYNDILSELLPQRDMAFGREQGNDDISELPVRLSDGRYVTLSFRGGKLVSLSVFGGTKTPAETGGRIEK